ncbi:MAG: thiamine pyrophosphate-dependent enzyme, partial [Candidatus Heimdallarchaeota archaeon]|nr:thiamine pyrophosphate-dependent enzyme [Candidatus Heimdallarchaeota archaeon]
NSDLRRAKMTIKADPAIFLQLVSKNLSANHEEWIDWKAELQKNEELREKEILGFSKDNAKLINPVKFFIHLKDKLPEKTIIIADGGDFISTMSYIIQPNQPLKWMDPGPFGTLGTGAGFAIAAKLCNPDYHVFLFYGDGSIGFSLSEFDTFIRHNIPILAIVGNDGAWSQIAREQISLFGSAVSTKLKQSEYHKVVEGFKGKGILIKTLSEVYPALESAYDYLLQNKAVLLNVLLDNSDFRKGSISM